MSATLKLGTRGSKLALWQAEWVKAELARHGTAAELVIIKTQGDADVDRVVGCHRDKGRRRLLGHLDLGSELGAVVLLGEVGRIDEDRKIRAAACFVGVNLLGFQHEFHRQRPQTPS